MTCERCNTSSRPAARCLVNKGDAEVERELCQPCREAVRQTYPVTVLDGPPDGQETPQDAPQSASGGTSAPKGRQAPATHRLAMDGGVVCRQAKATRLTDRDAEVSCRRCLARL